MKKFKKYIVFSLVSLLVISCGNNLVHEDSVDMKSGKMIFEGKVYSGEVAETRKGKITNIDVYEDGIKNGFKRYYRDSNEQSDIEINGKTYKISDEPETVVTSTKLEQYFEDGSLKVTGSVRWENNKMIRIGTWTQYDLEGNVKDTKEFDN